MTAPLDTASPTALLDEAITQHRAFAFEEAERLYRSVLALEPGQADALHNLGVLYAIGMGRPADALPHFEAALNLDGSRAQFWFSYVDALIRADQGALAEQVLLLAQANGLPAAMANSLVERICPKAPEPMRPDAALVAKAKRGSGVMARKSPAELAARMRRAQVAYDRGSRQDDKGQLANAEASFREALALAPDFADAYTNLALVLHKRGQFVPAGDAYGQALALQPASAVAHYNVGVNLSVRGLSDEADLAFRHALRLRPDFLEAQIYLDRHLQKSGRWVDAEVLWRDWLRLHPSSVAGFEYLGQVLRHQHRLADALGCVDHAIALEPAAIRLHHQRADVLKSLGRTDDAEQACRDALALDEASPSAWNHLAELLNATRRLVEAEAAFRKAMELDPQLAAAHANLGLVLQNQGRLHESEACMRHALALTPDDRAVHGNLLFVLNYHPDKTGEQVFAEYRAYEQHFFLPLRSQWRPHANKPLRESTGASRRLKVGYVSPDFRQHAVTNFLEPLLARHDRNAFTIYAYAQLQQEDRATARYKRLVDHWIPTRGLGDAELAERIRADGIDILVDLAGHTGGNRLDMFARKPAPVSLSWMGYGYTTGLSAIDYFLTDAHHLPVGSEHVFSEQPWRLPCAFVYRPAAGESMGDPGPLPALHNGHVTFGTLTRAIRINDHSVRVWAALLRRVAGSRLLVDSTSYRDVETQEALAARFMAEGIARERLLIGCHSPPWDLLRGVDIGLDCFPHNSGTTLFESLYMGIPFVTLAGRPSVGRLGSSILAGVGHPEWIAQTEAEYVETAAALAADLPRLAALRAGLRAQMQQSPLMNEAAFAREVEGAYSAMFAHWEQQQENTA